MTKALLVEISHNNNKRESIRGYASDWANTIPSKFYNVNSEGYKTIYFFFFSFFILLLGGCEWGMEEEKNGKSRISKLTIE